VASHCGLSWRALDKLFADFRGITPVAHIRNMRLDHARQILASGSATVAQAALASGFRSSTTFALEFRKRFGVSPSASRRVTRSAPPPHAGLRREEC
jgi:transcriptional regulator GlxA family with amidase domain